MKKPLLLLSAVFAVSSVLHGAELTAGGWKINKDKGDFTFSKQNYPLSIICTGSSETGDNSRILGRFHRTESVIPGKKYEINETFRYENGGPGGKFGLWVRGGGKANFNLFANPIKRGKRTFSKVFVAENPNCSIYLNLMNAPGEVEIFSVELNPADEK